MITAVTLVVVIAVSCVVYVVAEEKIKQSVFDRIELETQYFIRDLDRHFNEAEGIGNQIISNLILSGIMTRQFQLSNYSSIEAVKSVQQFQQTILNGAPYINDVKIYELYNGMCISNSTIEKLDPAGLDCLQQYSREFSRKWLDPGESCLLGRDLRNSRLLLTAGGYNQKYRCIVVVEMNNEWIYKQVEIDNLGRSSRIGILGSEDRKIYNEDFLYSVTEHSAATIKEKTVCRVNDARYLVLEEKSDINGWKYIAAVPETTIMPEILRIRRIIVYILISFGAILFSFMMYVGKYLIYELSEFKNLYAYLDHMESRTSVKANLKLLDNKVAFFNRELKHSYMMRLIQGNYPLEYWKDITERMQLFFCKYLCLIVDLKLDGNKHKNVLGFQNRIRKSTFYEAEKLVVQVLKQSEPSSEVYVLEDVRKSRIYVLLGFQSNDIHMDEMKVNLHFYQNVLLQSQYCISNIGIGTIVDTPEDICISKEEAEHLVNSGVMRGHRSSLFCAEHKKQELDYPEYNRFRVKLKLSLLKSDAEEIEQTLYSQKVKMLEYCQRLGYPYCIRDVLDILYEVSMEREISNREYYNDLALYFSEADNYFQDLDEFIEIVAEQMSFVFKTVKEDVLLSEVVGQAVEILNNEYQKNIGLQYVAEQLNISVPYLSKRFKEEVGVGFKEYLTDLKMKRAKEWIKNTEIPLKDIAVRVGYNDYKQFNAIFKKQFGMSAGEYRKTIQKLVQEK